jgi:hypothetical protein
LTKWNAGVEKNKLFVKDLSRDTSREQLEKIFSEFGTLKEVRLITYRNGHSKGLAFVEFQDEGAAAKALVKTDGIHFIVSFSSFVDCNEFHITGWAFKIGLWPKRQ